ncbi:hypothetical protein GUB10_15700 [Salegentibacter sp. BLCTC]|uniref:hypothetical protein n=1 Tax=Salegentibacter sp. BLCTC TaxID=2697368 RepID=UPI00187B2B03|nr:hypothetical protein [Salegentibacter sp. BLCTC]MBE7641778.1 hypothetical protein [Salegentibacter sp. BLCTC]
MKIIEKIKELFRKKEYVEIQDFDLKKFDVRFKEIDDAKLIDISSFIRKHLKNSNNLEIDNSLKKNESLEFKKFDNLILKIDQILKDDFEETYPESEKMNWNFCYFLEKRNGYILINNALTRKDQTIGNAIYSLTIIRKFNDSYFLWELNE